MFNKISLNSGFGMMAFFIIFLLGAVAGTYFMAKTNDIHKTNKIWLAHTKTEIIELADGVVKYYNDNGVFPSAAEGLRALTYNADGIVGWNGPYVSKSNKEATTDDFRNSYFFAASTSPKNIFVIVSPGKDKTLNSGSYGALSTTIPSATGDDIVEGRIIP